MQGLDVAIAGKAGLRLFIDKKLHKQSGAEKFREVPGSSVTADQPQLYVGIWSAPEQKQRCTALLGGRKGEARLRDYQLRGASVFMANQQYTHFTPLLLSADLDRGTR